MSKKQKIEIYQSDELAQIDEELDLALEQLETANVTVGGLLEGIEAENKEDADSGTPRFAAAELDDEMPEPGEETPQQSPE